LANPVIPKRKSGSEDPLWLCNVRVRL